MVSGSFSLPCSGFFSPFLHSTGSLSVSQEYLALRDGPRRFTQDFTCPALLRIPLAVTSLRIRDYHPLWFNFPVNSTCMLQYRLWSYNPRNAETFLVWALPRSLATTRGIISLFSSPGGTKMFQFPPFASIIWIHELHSCGLPHSEITGSMAICAFPMLIAAYHVLRRL